MSDWPQINGKPAARIRSGGEEKIGLPSFSNVVVGPISVERFVEDTPEAIDEGLRQARDHAERLIAEEREKLAAQLAELGIDMNAGEKGKKK